MRFGVMSKTIAPVPQETVHRIASGQVIVDLATAVKELLENALDAGATNIEVRNHLIVYIELRRRQMV